MPESILLSPPPVFFIRSISEQGYTLSTAIADLIDNSLSAGATRIEILLDAHIIPLKIFIADNGGGMTSDDLTENMRFPSADLELDRNNNDLGRFGLGLKTASFSQSRKFTVISRKDSIKYQGRTWDVEYLKDTEDWTLIIEDNKTVTHLIEDYKHVSANFHEHNADFEVNTLVIWEDLYKLEKLLKRNEINDELEDLRSHLGLIFHRFIQKGEVQIRLNNSLIEGFEPFPNHFPGVQTVSENYWQTGDVYIRFQGIILPKRSAAEAKESPSVWVPAGLTLEELQGIYVYRNERLINYGGWFRAIAKSIYLQFGRIRIDITNINDSEFHLNVAKSSLKIPFGLKRAMNEMVNHVAAQAAKEYRERLVSAVIKTGASSKGLSLIVKETGSGGPVLKINGEFELLRRLNSELSSDQSELLHSLVSLLENKLNEIWQGETSTLEINEELSGTIKDKIIKIKKYYEESDYSWEEIRTLLLDSFGRHRNAELFIDSLNIN
ncbi:hypothetical protein HDC92_002219 [Pedobacter sp. AK017]|uniref:ATP-binding protein n=1 Tax=Pedobacter sp. AK017 TaxID=2723073 RepID=UPI00161AB381|nr:ATP-binding protein [Pedobacter sp. AK017]MBB5438543.1 hypothetical protein [Pedobacter sp. AK017]